MTAWMKLTPPAETGSEGASSPSTPVMASATASPCSSFATTITVLDWSTRPCATSTFCPVIDSNSLV